MEQLIKTIKSESGTLYSLAGGRRIKLAVCTPRLEIMERITHIPTLGRNGGDVKRIHFILAICDAVDYTRRIDEDYLSSISGFDLEASIWRNDGISEVFYFQNMDVREINLDGEWLFDIIPTPEQIKKLKSIFSF
jgi:hypothetical protein|nr:MAG TPA: hypothetical protein [Caudoviricetes sp.]